jgi:hypothetical protein
MTEDPLVYTLVQFQQAHCMKPSKFYNLISKGFGPKIVDFNGRKVIYGKDAAAWRQWMAENPCPSKPQGGARKQKTPAMVAAE